MARVIKALGKMDGVLGLTQQVRKTRERQQDGHIAGIPVAHPLQLAPRCDRTRIKDQPRGRSARGSYSTARGRPVLPVATFPASNPSRAIRDAARTGPRREAALQRQNGKKHAVCAEGQSAHGLHNVLTGWYASITTAGPAAAAISASREQTEKKRTKRPGSWVCVRFQRLCQLCNADTAASVVTAL